jgi:cytidylate kinase
MRSIEELINRQLKRWESEQKARYEDVAPGFISPVKPIVTISRQRGSRGSYLADMLADKLGYQRLHRDIIDEICRSSGYRRRVIESLDNRVRSRIELMIEGAFKGIYIDAGDYFRHLYKVIMSISEHGGVVTVGRAANFILNRDQGFHVRVVASLPVRVANLMQYEKLPSEEAEREILRSDAERARFVQANFKRNIDDPGAYDLIVNTTYIDLDRALEMVLTGMRAKSQRLASSV